MDHELVDRARAGDRQAFALIIDACFDRCYEIARRVLGESHLAQDATQQAMLAIWRDLPKLRETHRFEAWSYRITVNACYAEAKRARRSIPVIDDPERRAASGDEYGRVIDRDQIERAFSRQKLEHRAVLVLRYYLAMPVEEIATTLEIPVGTAKSRIHHALKAMRAAIDADDRPPSGGSPAVNDFPTGQAAR
jgi:RNA polymerase sigma-70 factor (ECF subfamily)